MTDTSIKITVPAVTNGTITVTADSGSTASAPSNNVYTITGASPSATVTITPDAGYTFTETAPVNPVTATTTVTGSFVSIVDGDTSKDDYIGHDTLRKHLLLKVPDYELTGTTSARTQSTRVWAPETSKKNSYIQIGDATKQSTGTKATRGNDLLNDNINFLDDKRNRGTEPNVGGSGWAAMATPPSETTARTNGAYSALTATASATGTGRNLQVTADIPNYVGWRDHTDGHRITTTRGDKIEIIGGNYKFVCLGRGTGVAAWDISGGIMKDSGEDPGNKTSVSWVACPTDPNGDHGWKVVEQTVCANNVERFHGTVREEAYGDRIISVIGAPPEQLAASLRTEHSVGTSAEAGAGLAHAGDGQPETYVGRDSPATGKANIWGTSVNTYAFPTKWDVHCGVAPKLQSPAIYESTWATEVTSYTCIKGALREYTETQGDVRFDERHDSHVYQEIQADEGYKEVWYAKGWGFVEQFFGICASQFYGMRNELFIGAASELFVGAKTEVTVGNVIELSLFKTDFGTQRLQAQLNKVEMKLTQFAAHASVVCCQAKVAAAKLFEAQAHMVDSKVGLARNRRNVTSQL